MKPLVIPFPITNFEEKPHEVDWEISGHNFYVNFEYDSHRRSKMLRSLPHDITSRDITQNKDFKFLVNREEETVTINIPEL